MGEAFPTFEGDALLAIVNMRGWPEYAKGLQRPFRCVVLGREPEARLRSLYLYSRSGGEYWVRSAGIARRLNTPNTTESLLEFWDLMGRGYLEQSHEYVRRNVQHGCRLIPYSDFARNFNATVRAM